MRFSKTALRLSMGVLSAVFMFSATPAQAGILLDPYLGYELGTTKTTLAGGAGSTESDNSGVALGARVGYTLPIVWFGLDYSMVNGGKSKAKSNAADADYDRSTLYAMVGATLPLIRGWVGYGFMNDVKLKGGGDATFSGPAIKLGAGFTGLPFVSLNLEYIMTDFKKVKAGGIEQDISGPSYSDAKNNTVMLSVSVPFDL